MKHGLFSFASLSVFAVLALAACNRDDATVTALAQGRVNLAINRDSDVQVVVRDGNATLTGVASSGEMRTRAEQAARSVEGVQTIDDQINTTPSLTAATVPR
jgi:hypothetical protein